MLNNLLFKYSNLGISKFLYILLAIFSLFNIFTNGFSFNFFKNPLKSLLSNNDKNTEIIPKDSNSDSGYFRNLPAIISSSLNRNEENNYKEKSLIKLFRSIEDFKIIDTVLISTIDGSLHALDRNSGEKKWTLESVSPLVHTQISGTCSSKDLKLKWIVEPHGDGLLYTLDEEGFKCFPVSIKSLVMDSPFAMNGDDKVYIGSQSTNLYAISKNSGKIISCYGDDCEFTSQYETFNKNPPSASETILIGKSFYRLMIYSRKTGCVWNITYSTWDLNYIDKDLALQYQSVAEGVVVTPLPDGSIVAFNSNRKTPLWIQYLPSVGVSVFDIFTPKGPGSDYFYNKINSHNDPYSKSSSNLHVLPQPPLKRELNSDNNGLMGAIVQQTDDGSLYALSEVIYPAYFDMVSTSINRYTDNDDQYLPASNAPLGVFYGKPSNRPTIDPPSFGNRESKPFKGIIYYIKIILLYIIFFAPIMFYFIRISLNVNTSKSIWDDFQKHIFASLVHPKDYVSLLSQASDFSNSNNETSTISDNGNKNENTYNNDNTRKEDKLLVTFQVNQSNSDHSESEVNTKSKDEVLEKKLSTNDNSQPGTPANHNGKRRKRGCRGGRKNKANNATANNNSNNNNNNNNNSSNTNSNIDSNDFNITKSHMLSLPNSSLQVSDEIIGYGSHGTVVYKGLFEGREVAVKRMLIDFYEVASHEVALLQESDDHPNVIRYYCKQQRDRFLYIALELCPASLSDIVERPNSFPNLSKYMDPVKVLYQLALGVHYLHGLKIVHRDIKPQNILVSNPKQLRGNHKPKKQTVRILISDFGLCKKLEGDESSFRATTAQAAGTAGWRAPETLLYDHLSLDTFDESKEFSEVNNETDAHNINGNLELIKSKSNNELNKSSKEMKRVTRAIDIFSLGCVFYYILSKGSHPFGERYFLREGNILKNLYSLDCLNIERYGNVEAKDLIEKMISNDPNKRPKIHEVLLHPYFWPAQKRLDFLLEVSDRFEVEQREPPSELLQRLEENAYNIIGNDFYKKLDKNLVENLGKYRKYHGDRILDLLRALRNKKHHYQDLPVDVQKSLGSLPEGFLAYFTKRFPYLLLHTYGVVSKHLSHEAVFIPFFTLDHHF